MEAIHAGLAERHKASELISLPDQSAFFTGYHDRFPENRLMHSIPRRVSLITQTIDILRQGIAIGRWQGRLPGERRLCEELQVSRWTIRAALADLHQQGTIQVRHGHACRIGTARARRGRTRSGSKNWTVGLILPEPVWRLRPFVALWIDALRTQLHAAGNDLHIYHGAGYYGSGYAKALHQLTRESKHDCWGLLLSTERMQRWFQQAGLRVVLAGSSFPDISLASVDLDFRAMGRHAAALLWGAGHRRIGYITSQQSPAGLINLELGMRDVFNLSRHAGSELITGYFKGEPVDSLLVLDRLLARPSPPTALIVTQSSVLVSTISHLAQRGLRVGHEISVLGCEDEPYLRHFIPEITHYSCDPLQFARRFSQNLRQAVEGGLPAGSHSYIMPDIVRGSTLVRLTAAPPNPHLVR